MYFDERNNFVEEGVPVITLVFKIIDIIGLIDLWYLTIEYWAEILTLIQRSQRARIKPMRCILISRATL